VGGVLIQLLSGTESGSMVSFFTNDALYTDKTLWINLQKRDPVYLFSVFSQLFRCHH
jgi:hypothetical protein